MTETWLREHSCNLYGLENYDFVENHRKDKTGGGVGIFVYKSVQFKERNDLCLFDEYIECVIIEVDKSVFNTRGNLVLVVLYRPPNTDVKIFIQKLNIILDQIKRERKLCYIMGDYNINILNYESNSATAEFVDTMYAFTFLPLINRPTRITQYSATLIDNIFTNNLCHDDLCFQGILVSDVSDHFPVFHINYGCAAQVPDECIVSRNFSYQNKIAFHEAVAEIDWGEMYTLTEAQSAFSMFHSTFTKLFNQHFPKRKIKIKYNNRKPWLTDGLKKSIRIKNKLYMKYIRIKSAYYECTYKMYRNRLTRLIKIAERKYYADLLESNKSNLKKTWNILKTIINKKKGP